MVINGINASPGIAIAYIYRLENQEFNIEKREINDTEHEMERFKNAIKQAKKEIEEIREQTKLTISVEEASIFDAHLLVLEDPELFESVSKKIEIERLNAEYATSLIADQLVSLFESMDNEYMKERAADIRDVTKRLISILLHIQLPKLGLLSEEVIIVAEDLTPSDTAQLNRQYVKGFVTSVGGRTSHSSIMARSLGIPAVVGTKNIMEHVADGTLLIVDGLDGKVIINPSEDLVQQYHEKKNKYELENRELKKLINTNTITTDGYSIELAANIGTPDDIQSVIENGGEGVGLYRTEFLYMGRSQLPSEEEQFNAYKTVLEKMKGKPVVVRTLDIGGDKELPYLQFPKEMNPFLGLRAIRFCLEEQVLFRTQLRALLRASTYGNLKIMFPMIATLEELRQAKMLLLEEEVKLQSYGIPVAENIEIGMMIETPASVIMADHFAKEVDFFSIGTNDLIQYTMAADRMNENVSYLYQPYNPAILRLIATVIDAAHCEGKWVGMCGEMAGDPIAIPILLAFGLDEFSMSASSILPARSQIIQLSKEETSKAKKEILEMGTTEEVVEFVKNNLLYKAIQS